MEISEELVQLPSGAKCLLSRLQKSWNCTIKTPLFWHELSFSEDGSPTDCHCGYSFNSNCGICHFGKFPARISTLQRFSEQGTYSHKGGDGGHGKCKDEMRQLLSCCAIPMKEDPSGSKCKPDSEDNESVKGHCKYLECWFKEKGLMNETGELNKEKLIKKAEEYFHDEPEFQKIARESVDRAFEEGWYENVWVSKIYQQNFQPTSTRRANTRNATEPRCFILSNLWTTLSGTVRHQSGPTVRKTPSTRNFSHPKIPFQANNATIWRPATPVARRTRPTKRPQIKWTPDRLRNTSGTSNKT